MSDRLAQLRKLYDTDPGDPFIPYGIALEHAKAGDPGEAVAWLERTLELDARYHYAYFQKAKMLAELGRAEEATRVLDQGIERAEADGDEKAMGEMTELRSTMP